VIIDSSALVAILTEEPDFLALIDAIYTVPVSRISAGTLLETAIVVDARTDVIGGRKLDDFIETAGIIVEPVTADHARIGRAAYRDFGKGSGHPAQLNFGDCFAYALAKTSGEPLLFKGDDFGHTDVRAAV
jgi:ribonuclease VapC